MLGSCAGEAQPPKRQTVVLELFTSQGCSSCPPADALLRKLRTEDFGGATIVPLAYHVDYWNYLGWKDPFSSPQWSQRQSQYAQHFRRTQVYTPQLVINGSAEMVGSASGPIHAEIRRQLQKAESGAIAIERITRKGNEIEVVLTARLDASKGRHGSAVVALFEHGVRTAVASGENARLSLVNDAIVRWQGQALSLEANGQTVQGSVKIPLSAEWNGRELGVAAFLQDSQSLAIHAATTRQVEGR